MFWTKYVCHMLSFSSQYFQTDTTLNHHCSIFNAQDGEPATHQNAHPQRPRMPNPELRHGFQLQWLCSAKVTRVTLCQLKNKLILILILQVWFRFDVFITCNALICTQHSPAYVWLAMQLVTGILPLGPMHKWTLERECQLTDTTQVPRISPFVRIWKWKLNFEFTNLVLDTAWRSHWSNRRGYQEQHCRMECPQSGC